MVKSAEAADAPVPLNDALCVPTLSTTARVADALPVAAGVKVMPILQELPALRVLPQLLAAILKSEALVPLMAIEVIGRGAVPALASVKVCDVLVDPTVTLPKDALDGVSTACGASAPAPVPVNAALCVPTESIAASVADALPTAAGVKVTPILHEPPALRVLLQLLAAILKSEALVPLIAIEVIGRGAVPVFASVKVCDALVDPTVMLPKDALAGVSAA